MKHNLVTMVPKANNKKRPAQAEQPPYSLLVSQRFLVLSLVSSILVAFGVGRTASLLLIDGPQTEFLAQRALLKEFVNDTLSKFNVNLPDPVLKAGKFAPQTVYTSKTFDTALSISINSRWLVTEAGQQQCVDKQPGECAVNATAAALKEPEDQHEEEHLPAGQHLLMDIEHVEAAFLDSEERLAGAMLELVNLCALTLLSYHCHVLKPEGVTCVGVLLESHVSFHTWPERGVITLDLFTCGPNSLLPIVPIAKNLFSIPKTPSYPDEIVHQPQMIWAHKLRGFRPDNSEDIAEVSDLMRYPIGMRIDYKKEIASVETKFQRMDVYDVLHPKTQSVDAYEKSLSNDGSYESQHPELFKPDRIVFLDGVLQSRTSGDAAYHESLVHPAMFTHSNPKRVAIIGGGEGATLREVLKHKTVEKVVMIEIDEIMVNTSRKFLPDWSDCSNLVGSRPSCFDDPRTEIYYNDAFKWFSDRFADDGELKGKEDVFDVIIMDALDPQVQKDFVDALYDEGPFMQCLPKALSDDGILVAQVGQAPDFSSSAEDFSINKNRVKFFESLVNVGFEHIRDYEEAHCGFENPWEFFLCFKNYETNVNWFTNEAAVSLRVQRRSLQTVDGKSPFLYFDGATMMSYQYPSKQSEVVFCRREPTPEGCTGGRGYDLDRINIPISALEVKQSSLGEHAGRGVFAKIDIPASSYVGLEESVHNTIYMDPSNYALASSWCRTDDKCHWSSSVGTGGNIEMFMHGYGHSFSYHGGIEVFTDSTLHGFMNHGCLGKNNVGHNLQVTEATASVDVVPEELTIKIRGKRYIYNPANARKVHFYSCAVPRRDIAGGEELFDNYLGMAGTALYGWAADVEGLKEQCSGGLGAVSKYERQTLINKDVDANMTADVKI